MANVLTLNRRSMLSSKWIILLSGLLMSYPVFARDLESIASNLSAKTSVIANLLVPLGFAISAIFMIVGHPRGAQFMSTTIMAALISLGGSSIFNWLKGVVG